MSNSIIYLYNWSIDKIAIAKSNKDQVPLTSRIAIIVTGLRGMPGYTSLEEEVFT